MPHDGVAVHDLYITTENSEEEHSERPLDKSIVRPLERNNDVLDEVTETEIRKIIPVGRAGFAQPSFRNGSAAMAVTVTLLPVGKRLAQREAINFLHVTLASAIVRCLRHVLSKLALSSASGYSAVGILLELDPALIDAIERMKARLARKLRRAEVQANVLTPHVFYRGIALLLIGMFTIALALMIGAPYLAGWADALRSLAGYPISP